MLFAGLAVRTALEQPAVLARVLVTAEAVGLVVEAMGLLWELQASFLRELDLTPELQDTRWDSVSGSASNWKFQQPV